MTLKVCKIERIWNPLLWGHYAQNAKVCFTYYKAGWRWSERI